MKKLAFILSLLSSVTAFAFGDNGIENPREHALHSSQQIDAGSSATSQTIDRNPCSKKIVAESHHFSNARAISRFESL